MPDNSSASAPPPPPKSNPTGLAITSLVCGLAGIPFCVPGLLAMLFGGLALVGLSGTTRKGTGMAVSGIVLGILDMVGWIAIVAWGVMQLGHRPAFDLDEFPPELAAIQGLDPPLRRAMLANVLIERRSGTGRAGTLDRLGSHSRSR